MIVDHDTLLTCNAPTAPNFFALSSDAIDLNPGVKGADGQANGLVGMGESAGFLIEVTTNFADADDPDNDELGVANIGVVIAENALLTTNAIVVSAVAPLITAAASAASGEPGYCAGFLKTQLTTATKFYIPIGKWAAAFLPGQDPRAYRYMGLIVWNVAPDSHTTDAFTAGAIQGRIVNNYSHEIQDRVFNTGFAVT